MSDELPYSVKFSRGPIFTEWQSGHSRTAPPTIPGWLCLLPHVRTSSKTQVYRLRSFELLSIKAHRCSHSILGSVFSYLKLGENSHSGLFFVDQNSLCFWSLTSLLHSCSFQCAGEVARCTKWARGSQLEMAATRGKLSQHVNCYLK